MRNQFVHALQEFCKRRSSKVSGVNWWFSEYRVLARRVGDFSDESTRPVGRDPMTPTLEDAPLPEEFWQALPTGS